MDFVFEHDPFERSPDGLGDLLEPFLPDYVPVGLMTLSMLFIADESPIYFSSSDVFALFCRSAA